MAFLLASVHHCSGLIWEIVAVWINIIHFSGTAEIGSSKMACISCCGSLEGFGIWLFLPQCLITALCCHSNTLWPSTTTFVLSWWLTYVVCIYIYIPKGIISRDDRSHISKSMSRNLVCSTIHHCRWRVNGSVTTLSRSTR